MNAISIICPTIELVNPETPEEYLWLYVNALNPKTYYLLEDGTMGERQCPAGKNRSIQDLYGLLKTKFPDYSLSQLQEDISNIVTKAYKEDKCIYVFRCSNIERVVVTPIKLRKEPHWIGDFSTELVIAATLNDPEYLTIVQNFNNIHNQNKYGTYLQHRISQNQELNFESILCN